MKKLLCACLLIALLCDVLAIGACPVLAEGEPLESPSLQSVDAIEAIEELPDQSDELNLDIPLENTIDGDMSQMGIDALEGLDLDLTGDIPLSQADESLPEAAETSAPPEPDAVNTRSDSDLRSDFYYYRIVDGNAIVTDVEEEPVYNDKGDVIGWDKLQYVSVDIPQAIDGHPVTRIEGGTFKDARNLKKVSLPGSLKEIGWGAFTNCEALSDVTLPAGLELLDCNAFSYCVSLKSINIPIGVKTHGYVTERAYPGPFNGSGLSEVRFADGIETIVPGLFEFCVAMESITLPDTVVEIGRGAFMGCPRLKRVGLPASLKRINWSAFEACTVLSDITLPDGLEYLDCFVFNGCTSLKKINLPKNVACHGYVTEHAYSGPFVNCDNLREIEFAKGMKTVPKGIFFRCPGIRSITIPDTVETIEYGAFDTCSNLVTVNLPKSVSRINDYAFCWCPKLKNITLPAKLGYLGLGAFKGCEALKKINIPANVEMHGYVAANSYYPGPFSACSGLRKVTFAKGMTTIPHGLFYQCNGIRKITLPESIVTIENDAFCRCSAMTEIHIGKKVTRIGSYAFYGCDALKHVYYNDTLANWKKIEFGGNNEPLFNAKLHTRKKPYDLSYATVKVATAFVTGYPVYPKVTVKLDKKTLKPDDDYKLAYYNNIEPGTARVVVEGNGKYFGSVEQSFEVYRGNAIKVTFDPNGGWLEKTSADYDRNYKWVRTGVTGDVYKYGWLYGATKDGELLSGWFTKPTGGKQVKSSTIVSKFAKDHTLYAHWTKAYHINYMLEYDALNNPFNPKEFSKNMTVKLEDPFREGYIFQGWYTSKKFSAKTKIDKIPKGTKKDITLYPKWKSAKADDGEKNIYILCIGGASNTENDVNLAYKRLTSNKLSGYKIKKKVAIALQTDTPTENYYNFYIRDTFQETTENDLSFVYLHGHGEGGGENGTGVGLAVLDSWKNEYGYSYSSFLSMLTRSIKGQIIFLPDVCYSGGFVNAAESGDIDGLDRLSIISSSAIDEPSNDIGYEIIPTLMETIRRYLHSSLMPENDAGIGRYTAAMDKGLKGKKADKNGNGISIEELYKWIKSDADVKAANQKVQMYSQNKKRVIFQ